MSRIWSHVSNREYSVACTGQTVFLYDANGAEITRFKGLRYAYHPMISPKGDLFVVKTNEGHLIWFSFDPPRLIKKIKCSEDGDENFCFSPDGERLYNLERREPNPFYTRLSIYRTSDFSLERRMSWRLSNVDLHCIEYDAETDACYLLGYTRDLTDGCSSKYFIARLCDGALRDIVYITARDHWDYSSYKAIEDSGFTENIIQYRTVYRGWQTMRDEHFTLAKAWAEHCTKL